jgi:hypothetical protein
MTINKLPLVIIYLVATSCCIPILRYFILFVTNTNTFERDKLVFARIYTSTPGLIITGIILFLFYKSSNKFMGVIFFLVGFIWLVYMIKDIIGETK